ncbi:MAG: glycosyltransferase family protein [Rhodospirillaceae bacterium]|nr:glycosyltransferase family protein [Rhodospirillaceae bacterium]MBT5459146.1 glycosyltransferase family protein [Rhodospirillaceae bacterium]
MLQRAAAAQPDAADICCDLGLALKALGRFDEAVEAQKNVTDLLPTSARAWSNYGTALISAKRTEDAIAAFIQAVALDSHDPELHYNLGNALLASDDPVTAEGAFLRALKIQPNHIGALTNLGSALKDQGRMDEAEAILRGTAILDPDNADLKWNLAIVLLTAGRFREGWAAYEARRSVPGFAVKPQKMPPWPGTPLGGKRLLVHAEQGFGDTIQFCRYLSFLPDDAAEIVFQVPERLLPLMGSLRADVTLVGTEDTGERCDLEAPLLSLPHLIGPADPVAPETDRYLAPDPDHLARWADRLSGHDGASIAICWQGNPDYRYDNSRSVPLQAFTPLSELSGIRLISLQQSPGCSQMDDVPWGNRITNLGDDIDQESAFIDSAAILATVDLVVTSDTAIAHLAGALGVPVWMALAHVPDWRWGLTGTTTPWYPTMRLFRQETRGDWDSVFNNIAAAIKEQFP